MYCALKMPLFCTCYKKWNIFTANSTIFPIWVLRFQGRQTPLCRHPHADIPPGRHPRQPPHAIPHLHYTTHPSLYHTPLYTNPPAVNRQTAVKTLPSRKFVCQAVKIVQYIIKCFRWFPKLRTEFCGFNHGNWLCDIDCMIQVLNKSMVSLCPNKVWNSMVSTYYPPKHCVHKVLKQNTHSCHFLIGNILHNIWKLVTII